MSRQSLPYSAYLIKFATRSHSDVADVCRLAPLVPSFLGSSFCLLSARIASQGNKIPDRGHNGLITHTVVVGRPFLDQCHRSAAAATTVWLADITTPELRDIQSSHVLVNGLMVIGTDLLLSVR